MLTSHKKGNPIASPLMSRKRIKMLNKKSPSKRVQGDIESLEKEIENLRTGGNAYDLSTRINLIIEKSVKVMELQKTLAERSFSKWNWNSTKELFSINLDISNKAFIPSF